jgi:hypothetical protein
MPGRLFAWWWVAEATVERLALPRIDPASADADVHGVVARSRLFAVGRSAQAAVERAWLDARSRGILLQAQRNIPAGVLADRIRWAACSIGIAAVTALLLQFASTSGGRGFQLIVPLGAGLAAPVVALAAGPLASAWQHKAW